MKKWIVAVSIIVIFLSACHEVKNQKKIGIVVPIEHQAMNEIVEGFKETLPQLTDLSVQIKVSNAQADINLQRAIIQQMQDQQYDIIAPIGLAATEATMAMVQNQPIVSLASSLSDADRKKQSPCHVAVVHDEISPKKIIAFIHEVYPSITRITLIHSASEKIYPDVKVATQAAASFGIVIKAMMINTLQDLYHVASAVPSDSEAILVLKDNLVVSGITLLANTANQLHIPLISSDQGSVQNGAAFALGMPERQIGVEGAKLAAAILSGKSACDIPIVEVNQLTVFINASALKKENQTNETIEKVAKKYAYQIEFVQPVGKNAS